MFKKLTAILLLLVLNVQDFVVVMFEVASPATANAETWMCSQDLNGDGVVDNTSELVPCKRAPALVCPAGYTYNETISECTASVTCPSGSVLNVNSDMCELRITACPDGFVYSASANACIADAVCSTGVYDVNRKRCEASYTLECPSGYVFNDSSGRCEATAGANLSCPPGGFYNSSDNLCLASKQPTCPSGMAYDATNAVCFTTPTCPSGTFDATLGKCKTTANTACPSGLTFSGNVCAASPTCPTNSMYSATHNVCIPLCSLTNSCNTTSANWLCPLGAVNCNSYMDCPYGSQYACNANNICTQPGVCSSLQIPITQYQCPTSGQIFGDLATCNNNCSQTVGCSLGSVSLSGEAYVPPYARLIVIRGYGNVIMINEQPIYIAGCLVYGSEYLDLSDPPGMSRATLVIEGKGSLIEICATIDYFEPEAGERFVDTFCFYSDLNVYGCTVFGEMVPDSGSIFVGSDNSLSLYPYMGSLYFYPNTYSCPLGNYPCSGNPPTCTAGQSCVTQNSTTTKYQCSLTGTQYDTMNQCTSNCSQSTSCVTKYSCPLGSQYACLNINGTYQCSPNTCIDVDATQAEDDTFSSSMLQDDGPRDADGNCLGQVYLFSGRGMRCRPPGLSVGLGKSCCKNRGNTVSDSMGSISFIPAAIGTAKAIRDIYEIAKVTKELLSKGYGMLGQNGSVWVLDGTQIAKGAGTQVQVLKTVSSESVAKAVAKGVNTGSLVQGLGNYLVKAAGPQLAGMFVTWATGSQFAGSATSTAISIALGANPITAAAMGVLQVGMSLFGSRCDQQDLETAMLNDSKYCHYVGDYCAKKYPILGCVQKAKSYCCFNSKLARIIHEQGRSQLQNFGIGGGWGDAKSPNCRGFTPEEFQMLDFSKIDMSEYFGDIQSKVANQAQVEQKVTQKVQEFYQNIR